MSAQRSRLPLVVALSWVSLFSCTWRTQAQSQALPSPASPDTLVAAGPSDAVAPPRAALSTQGESETAARAFALMDEALGLIDQQQWLAAKPKLEQARALHEYPNIVFQLARVHNALKEYEQTRADLDRFVELAGPNNPNAAEARLMRERLPLVERPLLAATLPTAKRGVPLGPVVTLAGGGAALIAALMTGLLSNAAKGELDRNCEMTLCPRRLEDVRDRGQNLQLATNVLFVVGVAAVAAGSAWWLFSRASASCTPGADGCSGSLTVGF